MPRRRARARTRHRDSSMKPRALCFFCSLTELDTGMPISTLKLIEHFSGRHGRDVHAVLPGEGSLAARLRDLHVTVKILPFARLRSPARPALFLASLCSTVAAVPALVRYLRGNGIRLVHFSDVIDMPFYPAARLAGCRAVAHLRVSLERAPVRVLYRAWTALFVDRVVCISEAVRGYYGRQSARASTVYNPGPDPAVFDPKRRYERHPALDSGRICVLSIAKFVEVKGHDNFVRLAAGVQRDLPGRAQFVILGNRAPHHESYYDRVMAMIREHDLERAVSVLQPVPHWEVPGLLAHTGVFVHVPRWQEGLGGVVLEAMAMEVPVVAFASGGVAECFTSGMSGYLVPHGDIDSAARRVVELISNEERRRAMGRSARGELARKFSYAGHFAAIERIYAGLFDG
ncbi:MAG: glycosyltransferase [Chitinivibrionales bacterium]|nr:glycosyltransferase [Chitinivibrionales bacterium]MBD3394209.1 glycosyltransferase [Chitinivibrionales bacterium]